MPLKRTLHGLFAGSKRLIPALNRRIVKAKKKTDRKIDEITIARKKARKARRTKRAVSILWKRANAEGRKYLVSVVIPAYNSEEYLNEAVNSILAQTIGAENIQIVIVNDGSTDGTDDICRSIAAEHPENVVYIHQENKGVSAARNAALDRCEGYFIGFLDADDKLSRGWHSELIRFANEHRDIRVFTSRTRFFGRSSGMHPLNYICAKNDVVDLDEDFDRYPLSATRSYFHYSALEGCRFNENVKYTEDSLFVHPILLKYRKFGALSRPLYYYRKHETTDSASDRSTNDPDWYGTALRESHEYILDYAGGGGLAPRFIQYAVMYDMQWRLKIVPPTSLGEEVRRDYQDMILALLNRIEDEVILSVKNCDIALRIYALCLKHGIPYEEIGNCLALQDDCLVWRLHDSASETVPIRNSENWSDLTVDIIDADEGNGCLHLRGRIAKLRVDPSLVTLNFIADGNVYPASLFPGLHTSTALAFNDAVLPQQIEFSVDLPVAGSMHITAEASFKGVAASETVMRFGKFALLNSSYKNTSYAVLRNGWHLHTDGDKYGFLVSTKPLASDERAQLERCYRETLMRNKSAAKALKLRKKALSYQKRNPNERLWLFTDRVTSAEDSGEVMFRYVLDHPIENVHPVFVIRDDVPDYERLKSLGDVVAANSRQHLVALMCAEKVISSAGDEWVVNPFGKLHPFVKDFLQFDYVFLQHGVIKDSLADWLYILKKNIKLFVTSAPRERQSIIDGDYGYSEAEVILTGLPRWDSFANSGGESKRVIYFMPTWRQYLSSQFVWNAKDAKETSQTKSDLVESEYYQFFDSFLRDERVAALLERYDYTLKFAPHPRMGDITDSLPRGDRIEILKPETFTYADAFREMSMLITDYSSVAFNIAILKKPIVYVQFDLDRFYSGHTGAKDYFEYSRDGFGPVVYDIDSLVECIAGQLESGMEMEDVYSQRVDEFFYWPPDGVSRAQLVLEHIQALDSSRRPLP